MEDLCKKFPRVCNCPYKDRIDNDFKNGKTAYYVCQWLKDTDYTISYSALKKYYDYLKQQGEIKPPKPIINIDNECLDDKIEKLLHYGMDNIKFDEMNPNVQVQWLLGLLKIVKGDKHNVAMDANLKASILEKLERPIPILKRER